MTLAAGVETRTTAVARASEGVRVATPAIVAIGCGALAARTAVAGATTRPTTALVSLFCALLIGGVLLPLPMATQTRRSSGSTAVVIALVGIAAFAVGRALVGGHAPLAFGSYTVATSSLAAVAEEAWFRRLCFGLLLPAGQGFAIGGSTILFAVVHVAIYGWWVLPLDLAAGVLLGWQRAATGSWVVPAATHVLANLLVLV